MEKISLIAVDNDLFPEFQENLLSLAKECDFAIDQAGNIEELLLKLEKNWQNYQLLIIELEWLNDLSEANKLRFKRIMQCCRFPAIGVGHYDEETSRDCQIHKIKHHLLKYQQPCQILSVLKALTYRHRGEDLRKHQRYLVDLSSACKQGGEEFAAEVLNISLGGLFLKSFVVLNEGSEVTIEFSPDQESGIISVKGKVVHARGKMLGDISADPPGMGIEFMCLPAEVSKKLEAFLKKLIANGIPKDKEEVSSLTT